MKSGQRKKLGHPLHQRGFEIENIRLVRIINGSLYYDWPWPEEPEKPENDGLRSVSRPYYVDNQYPFLRLIAGVLSKVSDIPDSVFFTTTFDYPFLPSYFPVPALSHGPTFTSSDIPFPWTVVVEEEINFHQKNIAKGKLEEYDSYYYKTFDPDNEEVWNSRLDKAAFYGSLWFSKVGVGRQVVMDLARIYPHLIEANFTINIGATKYHPYAKEGESGGIPGLISSIESSKLKENVPLDEYMRKFKYLIVLAGNSISGRLCTFLAHSGAVVLLQETDMRYHIWPNGQRLRPWVHYVPISFTAADLPEKIQWLQTHDALARDIARNGRNFGRGYLRLEDYYCYTGQLLSVLSKVAKKSALKPFNLSDPILL
jgi:hypothetical protein